MGKPLVAYFSASGTTERVAKELAQAVCDAILLGFPIRRYVAPTIFNSFLESYDFSGKKQSAASLKAWVETVL